MSTPVELEDRHERLIISLGPDTEATYEMGPSLSPSSPAVSFVEKNRDFSFSIQPH